MKRRDLIKLGGAALVGATTAKLLPGQMTQQMSMPQAPGSGGAAETTPADVTLRIAPIALEVVPSRFISTIGYNGTSPGPILRMREGKPVTVDVFNDTDTAELVHFHGLFIPPEADGTDESGTPSVPPGGHRRYQFTPRPVGTRWYHSHAMTNGDLHRGTYTGQFGFLMIDSGNDPGKYDQEVFLALRDWEPFYSDQTMDTDEQTAPGPQPEKPAVLDTRPNGLEVSTQLFSMNDKALNAGEPIRIQPGMRVLFHLLNASAVENRAISLPGHKFQVLALDGNPVPSPKPCEVIMLGAGERVDAIVEMNQPGVWILGSTDPAERGGGLGVVVEYANQHRQPLWTPPTQPYWDYTIFGKNEQHPAPDATIDMVFEKIPSGAGRFNSFTVNGKAYPHEREFVLQEGKRYRIVFHNKTDDSHPLHMHRHSFELVDVNGKPTSGLLKDTVIAPMYGRVTVDMIANQPGLSLFHCHIQQHMDFGFKALFRYA